MQQEANVTTHYPTEKLTPTGTILGRGEASNVSLFLFPLCPHMAVIIIVDCIYIAYILFIFGAGWDGVGRLCKGVTLFQNE